MLNCFHFFIFFSLVYTVVYSRVYALFLSHSSFRGFNLVFNIYFRLYYALRPCGGNLGPSSHNSPLRLIESLRVNYEVCLRRKISSTFTFILIIPPVWVLYITYFRHLFRCVSQIFVVLVSRLLRSLLMSPPRDLYRIVSTSQRSCTW